MYGPGQIIYDLVHKTPVKMGDDVWDPKSYPRARHTHFIRPTGRFWQNITEYVVYCPTSIRDAHIKLAANIIVPAPCDDRLQELPVPTVDFNRIQHALVMLLKDATPETLKKWWH